MNVLYLTYDGITDHIGRAQVAPYLIGLARRGYSISVISAEKPGRNKLVEDYARAFADCGIKWQRVTYRGKPPLVAQAFTLAQMYRVARSHFPSGGITVIHCRDLLTSLVGYELKRRFDVKLIFDCRDLWADVGLETKPFPLVYRALKRCEWHVVRAADKVVCLTGRAVDVLTDRHCRDENNPRDRFHVIPCCADFQLFDPARVSARAIERAERQANLTGDNFVLLYLGSLGPDYLLHPMLALFRQVLKVRPKAVFLFVSNNGQGLVEQACLENGINSKQIRFVSADRDEVPSYLSLADLSVVFIRADLSKSGCSPTKVAELFACNVPLIANTGVGDLDRIISLDRNGSVVVPNFEDETLLAAVRQVLNRRARHAVNIRDNSREFALEAGVERYAAVYAQLVEPPLCTVDRCAAPRQQETAIAQ